MTAAKPSWVESIKTSLGMQPPRVATDRVVPLQPYDYNVLLQGIIIRSLLAFDKVLDPERLHDTLCSVVERDGWQRFGARLRRRGVIDLEYHIPAKFSAERPAVNFSQVKHDMKICDHPNARHVMDLPVDTAIQALPAPYDEFLLPKNGPKQHADYLNSDLPMLGIHATLFSDATLVTMYVPHCVVDGTGVELLLKAWALALGDRDDEIPTPMAVEIDPLATIEQMPEEPQKGFLSAENSAALSWSRFLLGNLNVVLFPDVEFRTIVVPARHMKRLREIAQRDLMVEQGGKGGPPPRLSEGDVLYAWWARLFLLHAPRNSRQPTVLLAAISLRHHLPGSFVLNNLIDTVGVTMETRHARNKPLGHVANQIRTMVKQSQSREQVKSYASWWRATKMGLPKSFGPSNAKVVGISNIAMSKLLDLDFSGAAVGYQARGAGERVPLKPRLMQVRVPGSESFCAAWIIGKDAKGNYWMNCSAKKSNWPEIEERLAKEHGPDALTGAKGSSESDAGGDGVLVRAKL